MDYRNLVGTLESEHAQIEVAGDGRTGYQAA
jgi:hypothetical protein